MYGGGELHSWVPVPAGSKPMVSPLLERDVIPQIRRPRVMPSETRYPDVSISMRQGPHPRGDADYVLLPSRGRQPVALGEPEPQAPPEPAERLPPGAQWWADHLQ
jgi:hypothetical protein